MFPRTSTLAGLPLCSTQAVLHNDLAENLNSSAISTPERGLDFIDRPPADRHGDKSTHVSGRSSHTPDFKPRKNRRAPAERQRVSRACDHCKKKKTRCSGTRPCVRCVKLQLICEFKAEYHRGRPPSPEWSGEPQPEPRQDISPLPCTVRDVTPTISLGRSYSPRLRDAGPVKGQELNNSGFSGNSDLSCQAPSAMADHSYREQENIVDDSEMRQSKSSRSTPEPVQTDREGQYVGSSSGISFLSRVRRRLNDISLSNPSSSILTFGDPELPNSDSSFFFLPPKSEAKAYFDFYFAYAMPTYRFLHQPTAEKWLDAFYENFDEHDLEEVAREQNAIVIMLFAHAKKFPMFYKRQDYRDNSVLYFHAADRQLRLATGRPRLASVQARLCQCFYLVACSRMNHCRNLFGTVAHLIYALGLHRRQQTVNSQSTFDYIEQETRKRVFWSAYSLDKYLSAVLGRPSIFHDDEIDQELPLLVNDSDLSAHEMRVSNTKSINCVMLGPVLHIQLVRLVSGILHDLYGIKPLKKSETAILSQKHTSHLKEWRSGLPAFLDPGRVQPSLLIPLLQRQSRMLTLAYSHAVILANRPFLLNDFARLTVNSPMEVDARPSKTDQIAEEAIKECLHAAMLSVDIVDDLNDSNQIYPSLWFTQYAAFCAVVVLYVYTIRRRTDRPEVWAKYFEAAERCQRQIALAGMGNSLAQRYEVVLEEFRTEANERIVYRRAQPDILSEKIGEDLNSIQAENTRQEQESRRQQIAMHSGQIQSQMQQSYLHEMHQSNDTSVVRMDDNLKTLENSVDVKAATNDAEPSLSSFAELMSWDKFDNLVMDYIGSTYGE
ncbi:fungal-specific transcription factor domain-containing protein [Dipodascopsis tothii]|uniref:fungal-specific transcription factor domain-containing protein n=1 Tax=Dipodascopsis tothii TaxID=44089 RepID=UPI0034CE7B78